MKKSLLYLAFLFIAFTSNSQTLLRGTVVDFDSNQPIPNAKIGITQQGVGVLSNNKGYFSYRKYDKILDRNSKLLVSASGYKSLELDINQIREIYDTSAKIALTKGESITSSKENDIHVFWDVSEGMLGRDEEKELNFLENYLRQKGRTSVNFVVFNDKILFWKKDEVVDGDISRFRESIKNIGNIGPADYSLVQMEGAKEVLLFSNGNNSLGYLDVQQDVPVIIATTRDKYRDEASLKQIARYTSGEYLALDKQATMPVAQNKLTKENTTQVIKGFVSSEGQALVGAKIQLKGTFDEFTTDQNGQFSIPASLDDTLICSYLGMFTREVLVDDTQLVVDLIPKNNVLDEVVITANSENFVVNNRVIKGEQIEGAPGGITGRGYYYITAKDIDVQGKDITEVIKEKFSSAKVVNDAYGNAAVEVAGITYPFFIDGSRYLGDALPYYIKDKDINSIIVKDDPDELGIKYGIIEQVGYAIIVTTKQDTDLQNKYRYTGLAKGNDYKETVTQYNDAIISATSVRGTIKSLGESVQGASILRKGSFTEAFSNADGSFAIEASPGDELVINYLGMFPKTIKVPDSMELSVDVIPKNDVLDEVVITGAKEEILVSGKKISGNTHPSIPGGYTALGDFYITSKDIRPNGLTLERVVRDKFKGAILSHTPRGEKLTIRGKTPQYVVDGFLLLENEPLPFYISDTNIESIIVKDSPNLTSRYSITPIAGLAIIITTKKGAGTYKAPSALAKNNTYQEEVVTSQEMLVSKKDNVITGIVTSLGKPLKGATITVAGSINEYQSDVRGAFKVPAQVGDELTVRFLGMYPKGVTARADGNLVIDLFPKNNLLDEVTVSGDNSALKTVRTTAGDKKESSVGYDLKTITQEDIGSKYPDLGFALNGKFANIRAVEDPLNGLTVVGRDGSMLIIIDDQIFTPDTPRPFISPDRVKSITVTKGLAGSNRYGTLGRGGVVEILTTSYAIEEGQELQSALIKNNKYKEEDLGQLYKNAGVTTITNKDNIIRGVVRAEGKVLQGATVLLKGTLDEVYTNDKGIFEINAQAGDVLRINYLGMFPKEMPVELRKSDYIVNLTSKNNTLDEIVVQGVQRVDNTIQTAFGKETKDKIGYAVAEIKEEDFNTGATSLRDLITGRFSGVTVTYNAYEGTAYRMRSTGSINNDIGPLWVVNGTPYQEEPTFLDVQQIANITALKGLKAVSKYGTIARGGAFVITTKSNTFDENGTSRPRSGLIPGNNYQEETITASAAENEAAYITRLREIPNPNDQFAAYQQMARTQELSLEFYSDVVRYFQKNNLDNADKARSDLAYIARNNTKALRTLAYLYEEAEDYKKMLQTYERVLTIAPQESQSYRDMANALVVNKEYNKALEMYRNMLGERVKGVNFSGIEPVLKTELSRLVQLYKDKIEFERLPNEWLRADFKQDVRMVIEWTDASVPFEFQFVNPEKKFFKWMHTLEDNRDRLNQELKEGFQMEEFIIDDAPQGEWIINVQYLGEDSDYVLPPFLKYTIYRNYGTANETKQTRILKIFKQSKKVTLGKIEI